MVFGSKVRYQFLCDFEHLFPSIGSVLFCRPHIDPGNVFGVSVEGILGILGAGFAFEEASLFRAFVGMGVLNFLAIGLSPFVSFEFHELYAFWLCRSLRR